MHEFTRLYRLLQLLHTKPFPEFDYIQNQNSITPHVEVKWDHGLHRYILT